jgi:hypothetical protein
MRLPLQLVLQRGVVFLWTEYKQLDDPALAGQSKPKFGVVLSNSALDDPIVYVLTPSKEPAGTYAQDILRIPAKAYDFFPVDTFIDAGKAGDLEIGRDEFSVQYERNAVLYKGKLTSEDTDVLVKMILASPRVARRFKRMLAGV